MSIENKNIGEILQPVAAREAYMARPEALEEFQNRVADGQIQLVEVDRDEKDFHVNAGVFLSKRNYPGIDFTGLANAFYDTPEQVAQELSPSQRTDFLERDKEVLREKSFQVRYAQHEAWWISPNEDSDYHSWLNDAKLYDVHEVEVEGKTFIVNDFSGKVNVPTFIDGIAKIAKDLASRGLNVADFYQTINVVPEDYPHFIVPERVRVKNPKLFVGASATPGRKLFTFNERSINEASGEDNGLTLTNDWEGNFYHEFGHLLDPGLFEEGSVAGELGWRKRIDFFTDDYGDLIELDTNREGRTLGAHTINDEGTETFISNFRLPETLISSGKKDETGKEIAPPSKYGHEKSGEDIAESFAAYALSKELDERRRKIIEDLVKDKSTMEPKEDAEVVVRQLDLKTFNPFDYLTSTITYKHTGYSNF